ncbi:MAG: tRNA-binding protein [Chitinophagia bacterium]|nr:tRNA-binding protein [Chitinophagia bacterium]
MVQTECTAEQYSGMDLRVGTILAAAHFPEARKPAFRLMIDFGPLGVKRSSAQITERYGADELIGVKVVAVMNLPVKRIAGFKSECLVLGVPVEGNGVVLLRPEGDLPDGSRIV